MTLARAFLFVLLVTRGFGSGTVSGAVALDPKPGHGNEYTYTITTVVKVIKPCDPAAMNDVYQDVRVLAQDNYSYTLEVTFFPLNDRVHREREERYEASKSVAPSYYLQPTTTCNWDPQMRRDLISQLRADGIDPSVLSDVQLVERVSQWALNRSKYLDSDPNMPLAWYVDFPQGKPRPYPALLSEFDRERPDPSISDQQMMGRELLGRSMFYGKTHGACTSSSVYLATILRALGIPTRILYFVPPCDPNDPQQVAMLTSAIHDHDIRANVTTGTDSMHGFCDHMYDEVYIGGRWVRLNYDVLDQGIVDPNYLGLMMHIDTCRDIDETHLASTWGVRSAEWPNVPDRLTSVNPYMLIRAWDHFGKYADIDNPPLPVRPQLTRTTITGVYYRGTGEYRSLVSDQFVSTLSPDSVPDFLIEIQERLEDQDYHQYRDYYKNASRQFVLHSSAHPDVHITLDGIDVNDVDRQGFGAQIDPADQGKLAPGATYTIEPVNTSTKYYWTVRRDVELEVPN